MAVNAAWLQLALTAADLIAWAQTTLLDGDLAVCEPKALRYRLLHVAARLTRGQRRLRLRIARALALARRAHRRVRTARRPPAAATDLTALPLPANDPEDPGEPATDAGGLVTPRNGSVSTTRRDRSRQDQTADEGPRLIIRPALGLRAGDRAELERLTRGRRRFCPRVTDRSSAGVCPPVGGAEAGRRGFKARPEPTMSGRRVLTPPPFGACCLRRGRGPGWSSWCALPAVLGDRPTGSSGPAGTACRGSTRQRAAAARSGRTAARSGPAPRLSCGPPVRTTP